MRGRATTCEVFARSWGSPAPAAAPPTPCCPLHVRKSCNLESTRHPSRSQKRVVTQLRLELSLAAALGQVRLLGLLVHVAVGDAARVPLALAAGPLFRARV